jgi:pyruvate/2-oxoglutarate dehydrogenase complex dihydrolipoamide dehydrogenase (E3) component
MDARRMNYDVVVVGGGAAGLAASVTAASRVTSVDELADLLVAGRCLSAPHEARGSARVIGTCLTTGQAAGVIAARLADP